MGNDPTLQGKSSAQQKTLAGKKRKRQNQGPNAYGSETPSMDGDDSYGGKFAFIMRIMHFLSYLKNRGQFNLPNFSDHV